MNTYPEGSLVNVVGYFFVSGTATDTTAMLTVVYPSQQEDTFVYGTDALLTRNSTGVYARNLDTTGKRGMWIYTWWSVSSVQADSGEQEFFVI